MHVQYGLMISMCSTSAHYDQKEGGEGEEGRRGEGREGGEGGGGEEEEDDGKTKTQKAQVRRTIHVVPDNSRVESGSKNLARG